MTKIVEGRLFYTYFVSGNAISWSLFFMPRIKTISKLLERNYAHDC